VDNMIKLAVITPTKGERGTIAQTVASAVGIPVRFEHVIVAPANHVDALKEQFSTCRVVPERGTGMYAAVQQGLDQVVDCDVFTWLNDDDVLELRGFSRALEHFCKRDDLDVVYGRVRWMDAGGIHRGEIPVAGNAGDWLPLISKAVVPVAQPGTIVRTSLFRQLGGFDLKYSFCGDLDLFARIAARGSRIVFVPHVVATFRIHQQQLSKIETDVENETEAICKTVGAYSIWIYWGARLRFIARNLSHYLSRFRRFGLVTMRHVYRQG
jgi:hypothetical protein